MQNALTSRRKKLKQLSLNHKYLNNALIYQFLNTKILDSYIIKLDNLKTYTNSKSIIKKGYFTSEEQFLDILNNFIIYLERDFFFLGKYKKIIIEIIIEYKKNNEFLFCKNYWGNNYYIPYFEYNIKKFILTGFYNNLKILVSKSPQVNKLLKNKSINIKKISLNNKNNVTDLYNLLIALSLCNSNQFSLLYLFEDFNNSVNKLHNSYKTDTNKSLEIMEKQFIIQWEIIIGNYEKKKDAISYILQ